MKASGTGFTGKVGSKLGVTGKIGFKRGAKTGRGKRGRPGKEPRQGFWKHLQSSEV